MKWKKARHPGPATASPRAGPDPAQRARPLRRHVQMLDVEVLITCGRQIKLTFITEHEPKICLLFERLHSLKFSSIEQLQRALPKAGRKDCTNPLLTTWAAYSVSIVNG